MKIQNKLLGAFLLVAAVPLLVLGSVFYLGYRNDLRRTIQDHLRSVASIQQSRLNAVLAQNEERLALVASRTQLRLSLRDFLDTGNPEDQARMNRILTDAAASIADLVRITVFSPSGVAVASTEPDGIGEYHFDPDLFRLASRRNVVDRIYLSRSGTSRIFLTGPIRLEGRDLGVIVVRSEVQNLLASLGDYSGLGESGETVLVRPDPDGGFVFLAPTRFDAEAGLRTHIPPLDPRGRPSFLAEPRGWNEAEDYRGKQVLAVTREVPGTDWILAVKIDRDEAFADLDRVSRLALLLLIGLLASTVAVAIGLARSLSAPLVRLSQAARAIGGGDFQLRLPAVSRDEIGVLEESFNHMSEQIARQIAEINTLEGIIPICSGCKKIRDDKGYWTRLEAYISEHSQAMFSHGLCPDCLERIERSLD